MRRGLIVPLILVMFCGTTYYVDPSGNDSNDGSSGSPWLTIGHACNYGSLAAGDTITVNDGTYTEKFIECKTNSGTSGNVITLQSTNQYGAVIDPSLTITGWSNSGESADIYHSTNGPSGGVDAQKVLWRVGATSPQTLVATEQELTTTGNVWWDTSNSRFKLYWTGEDPSVHTWKGWDNSYSMEISNVSYWVVDGFHFVYSRIGILIGELNEATNGVSFVTVQNSKSEYHSHWGMAFGTHPSGAATDNVIDSNIIRYIYDQTLGSQNGHCVKFSSNSATVSGLRNRVSNNTIDGCYYHGIQTSNGYDNSYINGNTISNASLKGSTQGGAIRCGTTVGCYVYDNVIDGGGLSMGVMLQFAPDNVFVYNNIITNHGSWGILGDCSAGNCLIYNNLIYDGSQTAINITNGTGATYIYNNTIVNNAGDGINVAAAVTGVVIKNNIFYSSGGRMNLKIASGATGVVTDNNSYYQSLGGDPISYFGTSSTLAEYQSASGQETNGVYGDPLFTDLSGDDYTLTSSSPGINIGVNLLGSITNDLNDRPRFGLFDIGAYEYGSEVGIEALTLEGVTF